MQNTAVVNEINTIIQTNIDREEGYRRAIDQVEDEQLRALFQECANQSTKNIVELEPIVAQYGGAPAHDSSTAGDIYRAWMDFKSELTGDPDQSTLKSCERGEEAALNAYQKINTDKKTSFPPHVHQILNEQHAQILNAYNRIKSLRDSQE